MASQGHVGTGIFNVKYTFNREELRELGLRLADKARTVFSIRAARASAVAEFAGQIKTAEREVAELVDKLNSLSEHRDVECAIHYHEPKQGYKTILRLDNGELAREPEPMSEAEMQSSFVFVDAPKDSKPKPQ